MDKDERTTRPSTNLDLVRSIYAAWERGDFGSSEWADPNIEYVIADGPSPGSWSGLAGMAEGWRSFFSAWEDYRSRAEDYRALNDQRVLVLVSRSGRGKTSGLEIGQVHSRGAHVFDVEQGKVTRLVLYADRDRALADLGLDPEAGSGDTQRPG